MNVALLRLIWERHQSLTFKEVQTIAAKADDLIEQEVFKTTCENIKAICPEAKPQSNIFDEIFGGASGMAISDENRKARGTTEGLC